MKLSALLGGTTQTENRGKVSEKNIASINRQIRSLVPGQTLQGEVVGKNGSEVQIKLADDMVLSARLEREIAMEVGKTMTFEVKNNGATLSLSPLFANMAADANVLKALEMANIPLNGRSLEMTEQMMQQGMSIDKNALQSMYREVVSHQGASPANIVQLYQLGMEVTPENLTQLENYKALQHQLVTGMTNILDEIPMQFQALLASGDTESAVQLYAEIAKVLSEGALFSEEAVQDGQMPNHAGALQGASVDGANAEIVSGMQTDGAQNPDINENMGNGAGELIAAEMTDEAVARGATGKLLLTEVLSQPELDHLMQYLQNLDAEGAHEQLQNLLSQIREGSASPAEVLKLLGEFAEALKTENGLQEELVKLLGSKEYGKLLKSEVMRQWLLEPEAVQDNQKVSEIYERLNRQLAGIRQALADVPGGSDSSAMKSVTAMQNNLDFMNQVNQLYSYVQLPLNMSGKETHGELYVYTNKKHLAQKDGNVSALLHLDMDHLGPVDVYVAMQNSRVNTKFYLQDDDMIDFIESHIHILNERLEKRGYSMNCEMITKQSAEEQGKSMIDRMTEGDSIVTLLSQYAFDVRA